MAGWLVVVMLKIEALFGAAEKLRYSLGMLGISLLYNH
jgi:hypothetical protein